MNIQRIDKYMHKIIQKKICNLYNTYVKIKYSNGHITRGSLGEKKKGKGDKE